MELFELIKSNIEILKNCRSQDDLHRLIIENKVDLKNISEEELYRMIRENKHKDIIIEDDLLENVAGGKGGATSETQKKLQEKFDPSTRKGNLSGNGLTMDQLAWALQNGDDYDDYYEKDGLYYKLS